MLPVTDSIGCMKLGKRAAKRSKCAAKAPGNLHNTESMFGKRTNGYGRKKGQRSGFDQSQAQSCE